jgi:acyl-coenzyme A synthetase/AMP-(fatty) acid ligase
VPLLFRLITDDISDFSDLLEETNSDAPLPIVEKSDPAVILYTSGTTAKPKGVDIPITV